MMVMAEPRTVTAATGGMAKVRSRGGGRRSATRKGCLGETFGFRI